jgi:ketosteroid isomerase-like protein
MGAMKHPNTVILSKIYSDLAEGNTQGVLDACNDSMTFQIAGKSPLAGKYTKANLTELLKKQKELSHGSYSLEVHDIMASDQHGTVLATMKLTVGEKPVEIRTVHVWRMGEGKALAWYEYPRDLYAYDAAWGAK